MKISASDYEPVSLSAGERALVAQHRQRFKHQGCAIVLKSKILKVANDFSTWLQRNPEWSHADDDVFFKRFGYMPSPDDEARAVFAGVMVILAALEAYMI